MQLKKLAKFTLSIIGIFFLLHGIRNGLQALGMDNFITNFGHDLGVRYTNFIFDMIGTAYNSRYEYLYAFVDIAIAKMAFLTKHKIEISGVI